MSQKPCVSNVNISTLGSAGKLCPMKTRSSGLAAVASFQSIYFQAPLHGDVCVLEAAPLQLVHPEDFDNSIFNVAFCSPCINPCLALEQNFPSKLRIIQLLHLRPG